MLNNIGTREIFTERLKLRKYEITDAQNMLNNYAGDNKVTKFLPWEPYKNVKDVEAFIQSVIDEYVSDEVYNWAIEYEGEIIGGISATSLDKQRENCEVGYCIGYNYWNKGITTEALNGVIGFLFGKVGMHRIMAKHDIENPASGEVMKKCQMKYEGCFKEYYLHEDGTYSDSIVYAIINKKI